MSARNLETRSYRIVELLGEGGFGKVYRARMENAAGFAKDVAVKLLTDRSPTDEVLARFRDESRILGLVRDRAVISVDPPTQLGGRWAVIMEYVPGSTCQALMKQHGAIPPRVALGIVLEVSRALDHVFRQIGPDGAALELVHRDLKPANLQITPSGEVKILDFGVARANYQAREAHTTHAIQGTYGYIAPERLQGIDTPAADIYSLGMVLYKITTGGPTDPKALYAAFGAASGDLKTALQLAVRMVAHEAFDRPSARQVEETCEELLRPMHGPDLRRWAERYVSATSLRNDDELVGKLLTATLEIREPTSEITLGRSKTGLIVLAGLTGVNVVLVVLAVVAAILFVLLAVAVWRPWEPAPIAVAPTPLPIEAPVPVLVPVPVPLPEPDPLPIEEAPAAEPAAPQKPAVATVAVDFGSQPLGADVWVDEVHIGKTPIFGHSLPSGRHYVVMRAAGQKAGTPIEVGKRKPRRFVWKGGDEWEVLY